MRRINGQYNSRIKRIAKHFNDAKLPEHTFSETQDEFDKNNEVKVTFMFPPRRIKSSKLLIMVCGFGEKHKSSTTKIYYDYIAKPLAMEGVTSVLLPLPFHLDRSKEGSIAPGQRIINCPPRFYLAYEQIIDDIFGFFPALKNGDLKVLNGKGEETNSAMKDFFATEDIEVHLLGYSMGGMAVSTCFFLDAFSNREPRFATYRMLSSGFNFKTIGEFINLVEGDEQKYIHSILGAERDNADPRIIKEIEIERRVLKGMIKANSDQWANVAKYHDSDDKQNYWNLIEKAIEKEVAGFDYRLVRDVFECIMLEKGEAKRVQAMNKYGRKLSVLAGDLDPLIPNIPSFPNRLKRVLGDAPNSTNLARVGHILLNWQAFKNNEILFRKGSNNFKKFLLFP